MSTKTKSSEVPKSASPRLTAESQRLRLDQADGTNWKQWGPYLSERQWGTVREDYSPDGDCWNSFPHDHARSRAYRWGEDGLLGMSDDQGLMCFGLALWNGQDPILKERLFGLTGPEGNHGEDVKEHYFYLDSTPTHSYMKALYKYPQARFPYEQLVHENRRRGRDDPEFELNETGVFDESRMWDVQVEYAKAEADDIIIRITAFNRGPEAAVLHVLPSLWFRNTWSWSKSAQAKPVLTQTSPSSIGTTHPSLASGNLEALPSSCGQTPKLLFTENESNTQRLWGVPNASPYVKDAFHEHVIHGRADAVNPANSGTKAAAWYQLAVEPRSHSTVVLRLSFRPTNAKLNVAALNETVDKRLAEADAFYDAAPLNHALLPAQERLVARQSAASLLWSKQFYHFDILPWLHGDSAQSPPPESRKSGRNVEWTHLNNSDIISMPDKWEYPWYAAWDLAFQMIPFARLDPQFAKDQLVLFLREWYMHPNGQIPAYEFAFGDVNPPVHAWAVWRVYKMSGTKGVTGDGGRDRVFLARCFQKLLLNFNWWVNRKDPSGKNLFSGGFLGLDNIGVFDRSRPLPTGGTLEQADGTAWMAFYCGTMLSMALELAAGDPAYEDMATKFFEHFVAITDAMNTMGGNGLWDQTDGFYYDQIRIDHSSGHTTTPLKVRSLVGIVPILAVEILESDVIDKLPDFKRRMEWFVKNNLTKPWHEACSCGHKSADTSRRLLAIPSRERLQQVVSYLMDETEFLSPYGVRSLSRCHQSNPYTFHADGQEFRVDYTPGESTTGLFGGNSNWRGPIWFPLNFLIIEALERYHHFYGDDFTVEFPKGSGSHITLQGAADEIRKRLAQLFVPDVTGRRPCHGWDLKFMSDPSWKDLIYFYEHFHGENGRGLGASHQTGWTALIGHMLQEAAVRTESNQRTKKKHETI